MTEPRYRVLAVATHPVQYMTPLFRRMAAHPALDLHVAYCSLRGAEGGRDPEFGADIQWDVPLLDGYAWSEVPNRGSGKESFFGLRNPGLWRLIRQGKFDAVLCFVGYVRASFWIACLASKLSNAAFLFGTDANSLMPRDGRSWKAPIKKFLWPHLFRLADQVIVPSSGSRDLMLSLGLRHDSVTLTPYCVENEWWIEQSGSVDRRAVRASWSAAADDLVILFCAKLQPWKRPLDLLQAFAQANIPRSILVFAGEGPLRTQLEEQAESLGISSRVRFLGFVNQSQLPAVYMSADLMVLPSAYEPFAVVVNEAMCCGCPVMVSDQVGAGPDLVAPVHAEFIFPAGEVEAIARILLGAAADRSQLREISRRGLAHMHNWSPKQNIAATVEAIRAAVARRRMSSSGNAHSSPAVHPGPSAPQKLHE
ncbi:MAG TPA: glycosyltransferase family 4 protein [Candidatus Acidoferrum sp.]|nr:glycosyltransferase family 4 protein [Candidatus Acidoferrum sp.]